jgi:hypothetical protein
MRMLEVLHLSALGVLWLRTISQEHVSRRELSSAEQLKTSALRASEDRLAATEYNRIDHAAATRQSGRRSAGWRPA